MKYACPCCGYKTFDTEPCGSFNICPVCYWEDDPVQLKDPHYAGGGNKPSLVQAQRNFMEFGACELELKRHVRKPVAAEARDEDWTPIDCAK
ncbi:MAG TPA: CPCC family cysteine-rich protein [Chitinophagaceae bacterium]|nr:CPCC family cysteine-rich protein [Chitinophagaceae bacterium]